MSPVNHGQQQSVNLVPDSLGSVMGYFTKQGQAGFTLGKGHNGLFVLSPDQGVHFPVSQAFSEVYDGWPLFNAGAIEQFAPSIVGSVPFAPLFLTA